MVMRRQHARMPRVARQFRPSVAMEIRLVASRQRLRRGEQTRCPLPLLDEHAFLRRHPQRAAGRTFARLHKYMMRKLVRTVRMVHARRTHARQNAGRMPEKRHFVMRPRHGFRHRRRLLCAVHAFVRAQGLHQLDGLRHHALRVGHRAVAARSRPEPAFRGCIDQFVSHVRPPLSFLQRRHREPHVRARTAQLVARERHGNLQRHRPARQRHEVGVAHEFASHGRIFVADTLLFGNRRDEPTFVEEIKHRDRHPERRHVAWTDADHARLRIQFGAVPQRAVRHVQDFASERFRRRNHFRTMLQQQLANGERHVLDEIDVQHAGVVVRLPPPRLLRDFHVQQMLPDIEFRNHQQQRLRGFLHAPHAGIFFDAVDHFRQDDLLPLDARRRRHLRIRAARQHLAETDVLRRIEQEEDRVRMDQMLRRRIIDGIHARLEMLAGVVIQHQRAAHAVPNLFVARMMLRRRHGEHERLRQVDQHVVQQHLVVQFALQFRLAQRHDLIRVRMEEDCLFEVVQNLVIDGIRVREGNREVTGQRVPQLPRHARQKIRFAAGRRADDRQEQRRHLARRLRDAQMAPRAGHVRAAHACRIDGVAFRRETRRQETQRRVRAQHGIADKALMPSDEQEFIHVKAMPAMCSLWDRPAAPDDAS